ncbi:transposase, partial [Staphylococcus aureus]
EYFKAQINQKLSEPETKKIYSQRKIDVEPVFGFMTYHPKMMLKIILYAYTQSVFSGRRIEKLLHDSIPGPQQREFRKEILQAMQVGGAPTKRISKRNSTSFLCVCFLF